MDKEPEPEKKIPKKKKTIKRNSVSDLRGQLSADDIKAYLSKVIVEDMLNKEMNHIKDIEIDSLIATNQEFMKCFVIIGYDLNEVPVLVFKANSQLQADALSSSVTKLVLGGGNL